jgi:hypothetical protein
MGGGERPSRREAGPEIEVVKKPQLGGEGSEAPAAAAGDETQAAKE